MSGWDLKEGTCAKENPTDKELWDALNHMFKSTHKTTTYKFCFLKSLLDCSGATSRVHLSFSEIFKRFAEIYWDLIIKNGLCQVYQNSKFKKSKVEAIIDELVVDDNYPKNTSLEGLPPHIRNTLLSEIEKHCSRNVVGAFFESTFGLFYSFSKKDKAVVLTTCSKKFLSIYRDSIEEVNYFHWAKMLEKINGDSTPKSLVTKMSRLGRQSEIIMNFAHSQIDNNSMLGVQKFQLEDILPWSF